MRIAATLHREARALVVVQRALVIHLGGGGGEALPVQGLEDEGRPHTERVTPSGKLASRVTVNRLPGCRLMWALRLPRRRL